MTEPDNFALAPRPSSAVEKVAPGTQHILSGMVTDTLALVKSTEAESIFKSGMAFYRGDGVKQDNGEAFRLFREAAERGLGWQQKRGTLVRSVG